MRVTLPLQRTGLSRANSWAQLLPARPAGWQRWPQRSRARPGVRPRFGSKRTAGSARLAARSPRGRLIIDGKVCYPVALCRSEKPALGSAGARVLAERWQRTSSCKRLLGAARVGPRVYRVGLEGPALVPAAVSALPEGARPSPGLGTGTQSVRTADGVPRALQQPAPLNRKLLTGPETERWLTRRNAARPERRGGQEEAAGGGTRQRPGGGGGPGRGSSWAAAGRRGLELRRGCGPAAPRAGTPRAPP